MGKAKRKPGRPRLTGADAPAQIVAARFSKGLLARLDKWRKAQRGEPTRSDAVRQLAEFALGAAGF